MKIQSNAKAKKKHSFWKIIDRLQAKITKQGCKKKVKGSSLKPHMINYLHSTVSCGVSSKVTTLSIEGLWIVRVGKIATGKYVLAFESYRILTVKSQALIGLIFNFEGHST